MTNSVKIVSAVASAALAFGAYAPFASALTSADIQMLQAAGIINSTQAAALMAQTTTVSASSAYTFTRDLTVGSSGADVTALQQALVAKGYLTIPAGTAYGYFGGLTRAAVARWQAAAGVSPAAGYFGPKSRAAFSGSMTTTTTTTTTTAGGTTTTTSGGITTPGVEGVLSVTAGPISNSVLNVGQTMVPVITVRAQAQNSDIAIGRITVDLGTNTNIYNKLFTKLYVVDNSTGAVLASTNLNNSTVFQSGNNYVVTMSGFSAVVPRGTYKDFSIKADLYSSIDSQYLSSTAVTGITPVFTIPANGVRGTDGAGIDQFGPASSFSQTVTINRSLTDNAQANISVSASTPITSSVPVTDTTNGLSLQVPVLAFNVNAQNDTLHLHQVVVNFVGAPTGNTTATATAAYLYNGSTQVASASISPTTGVATFANITDGTNGASIPVGTTGTFTVKADVTGLTAGSLALSASLNTTAGQTIIYNSQDSTVTNSGSAAGQVQTLLGKGPAVSLSGTPSITKSTVSTNNTSTSTLQANFNVNVQAVGANLLFGTQASTTNPMFVFGIYKDGSLIATNVASSSSLTLPTGITESPAGTFALAQNQSATIPVTFSFQSNTPAGTALAFGNYAVGIERVQYVVNGVVTTISTSGQTAWRTSSIVLP